MIEVKHMQVDMKDNYRCIVVSDIHSHCDRFLQLLKKVNYSKEDYLIIVGDFVEKGTQTIQTIELLQKLKVENDKVYVLLGNCEYALDTLINDPAFAKQMIHYLNKIGKSGMIDQIISRLKIDIKKENPVIIQQIVKEQLKPYLDYLQTLPTTLETKDFLFVHAGIEKRKDWKNSSRSSLIEMRHFQKEGHLLDKYVIVGHLPTSNFYQDKIDNDIFIDEDKKIISLDGGTGVKTISQLNALIIDCYHGKYTLTKEYVQPLRQYIAIDNIYQDNKHVYKVAWPHFEVEILEKGDDFSLCKQINTHHVFDIKNEFLYQKDEKILCLDDYINYKVSLNKGDIVKLLGIYGNYAYVIKDKEIGWVPVCFLQKYYDEMVLIE